MPIEIRSATIADAEAIQRIYAPFVLETAISFEDLPPSADEMAGRIASILKTHPWLVAVVGGKICGCVYATAHRERAAYRYSADTTIYIAPKRNDAALVEPNSCRGSSSATYIWHLPVSRCQIRQASLHEAMGFTPVGIYREVGFKLGRWHDVGWWQHVLWSEIRAAIA